MAAAQALSSKSQKRLKTPVDCSNASVQKEIISQQERVDSSGNYTPQQSMLKEAWTITPPPWLNPTVVAGIVTLKSQVEKDHILLFEHDKILTTVLNELYELKQEKKELRLQNQVLQKKDEWNSSERNARSLEEMFDLPKSSERSIDEILNDLDGCLKNYSDPRDDVLEDIQDIRSGW
ncbi:MAG: hypothetical protein WC391_05055 [Methanoregula sp.]|jgi:hypothetical protein